MRSDIYRWLYLLSRADGEALPPFPSCRVGRGVRNDRAVIEKTIVGKKTKLTAVKRNGHWSVMITWPNGSISHFGDFSSEIAAIGWIYDHRWMTTNEVTNPRLLQRRGRYRAR